MSYDQIVGTLRTSENGVVYRSAEKFLTFFTLTLKDVTDDKKLLAKIAEGLSRMDKSAEIQKDKKGNVVYDKETRDTEIVSLSEDIDDYMSREVLPHVPDAKAFFEEDLSKRNPVIKTGAEIPFSRFFYKYQQPEPSKELELQFVDLERSVNKRIQELFGRGD